MDYGLCSILSPAFPLAFCLLISTIAIGPIRYGCTHCCKYGSCFYIFKAGIASMIIGVLLSNHVILRYGALKMKKELYSFSWPHYFFNFILLL